MEAVWWQCGVGSGGGAEDPGVTGGVMDVAVTIVVGGGGRV